MTTLNFIVCANDETVGNRGEWCDEAADAWTRTAIAALERLPFAGDVRCDSHFPNWHGGRFAHQASLYHYELFGLAVCVGGAVDADDDGEPAAISWRDLSESERADFARQIWAALETADTERDRVQAEHDAEEARFAAECAEEADRTGRVP